MTKSDQEHFESYTLQNRIKHQILENYFRAYMRALGRRADAFHYIDGFAGAGHYKDEYAGSPLIALGLLAAQSQPWTASFVESDKKLFDQLAEAIRDDQHRQGIASPPFLQYGEFSDFAQEILHRDIYSRYSTVATFAFIDPCGVRGVRLSDISEILRKPFGECLLFWNYDGINRWLGAVAAGTLRFEGLLELFGDQDTAREALKLFSGSGDHKEMMLRDLFFNSIRRNSKAKYILPFRFEARDSSRTSHYLIHCSNDGLAFKIMKHVMDKASSSDRGLFELLNDADTSFQMGMFRPHLDKARAEILDLLSKRPAPVETFTERWVRRADDLMTSDGYRRLILQLEEAAEIQVLGKDGLTPMPASRRPKRQGKSTLGEDYILSRTK